MPDRSQEARDVLTPSPDVDELLELCTGQAHREVLLALGLPLLRARGGLDVTSLNKIISMDMGQLSRLLHRLEAAGLVQCRRSGRHHVYTVTGRVIIATGARPTLTLDGNAAQVTITLSKHELAQLDRAVRDATLDQVRSGPAVNGKANGRAGQELSVDLKRTPGEVHAPRGDAR